MAQVNENQVIWFAKRIVIGKLMTNIKQARNVNLRLLMGIKLIFYYSIQTCFKSTFVALLARLFYDKL